MISKSPKVNQTRPWARFTTFRNLRDHNEWDRDTLISEALPRPRFDRSTRASLCGAPASLLRPRPSAEGVAGLVSGELATGDVTETGAVQPQIPRRGWRYSEGVSVAWCVA